MPQRRERRGRERPLDTSHSNPKMGVLLKQRRGLSCHTQVFVCNQFPLNLRPAPKATQRSRQCTVPRLLPSLPYPTSAKGLLFTTTALPKSWKHHRNKIALNVPPSTLASPWGKASSTIAISLFSMRQKRGKGYKLGTLQAKTAFLKLKNWCQVHLHCLRNHNYTKCSHILQTFSVKRQEHIFLIFHILPEKTCKSLTLFLPMLTEIYFVST